MEKKPIKGLEEYDVQTLCGMSDLSYRMFEIMAERHLTPKDVADKSGITKMSICNYINGKTTPSAKKLPLLCKAFGVSANYLLGLTDDPTPEKE